MNDEIKENTKMKTFPLFNILANFFSLNNIVLNSFSSIY